MKMQKTTLVGTLHKTFLVGVLLALLSASALAQSLWRDDVSKPMYADKRGSATGDILTIIVSENTVANKNNGTSTEKKSSLSAAITSFLYPASAGGFLAHSGQMANALVQDGSLSITTKVEVLEDGAPGQVIHARNSVTRRDLSGRVLDDRTILISL